MNTDGPAPFDGKRWVAGATLLIFFSALLYSLFHIVHTPVDNTPPQRFAEAVREVIPELKAGDRILIHPPWREDVWQSISSSVALPAGVELNTALSRPHGASLHRIWVIHDDTTPLPRSLRRGLNEAKRKQVGEIEILFFESATKTSATQIGLDARIASAEVSVIEANGKETRCQYRASAQRHICPGLPEWMYVGVYEVVADGNKHYCIWNHPTTGGRVLTRFRQVELPRAFSISHALSDRAASMAVGAPVELRLRVDGQELAHVNHANRRGWLTDVVSLAALPPNKTTKLGDIEVEVQTTQDGMRHFCWSIHSQESKR